MKSAPNFRTQKQTKQLAAKRANGKIRAHAPSKHARQANLRMPCKNSHAKILMQKVAAAKKCAKILLQKVAAIKKCV